MRDLPSLGRACHAQVDERHAGLQTTTAGFGAPVAMTVGSTSMDGIIYYVLVLRYTPRLPLCKSS